MILLDKDIKDLQGGYGAVYEDFKKDIYTSLERLLEPLSKYETLKLVFPADSYFPEELAKGFELFCQQYAFERKVINNINDEPLQPGETYICLADSDLIVLIERIKAQQLKIGQQVGVISYNETPLKRYILNGITTISTNYSQMGMRAAKMILNNRLEKLEMGCDINLRASI